MTTRIPVSRKRGNQRGNTMMEFALASSLLFMLTFGVIDFSRLFHMGNLVVGAAAAGTQYGSLSPAHYGDFDGMQAAALRDAQNPPGLTATATEYCACSIGGAKLACPATCGSTGTPQRYVQVTATMEFQTLVAFPGIPSSTPVAATSIVRVQ